MQIENIFSLDEITKLQKITQNLPEKGNNKVYNNVNKDCFYYAPVNPLRSIIEPKVQHIVGSNAVVSEAVYRECNFAFNLHFDTQTGLDYCNTKKLNHDSRSTKNAKYNLVFMIPLVEGPSMKTAIFDIDDPLQQEHPDTNACLELYEKIYNKDACIQQTWLSSVNSLNPYDYDHLPKDDLNYINKLPLIEEVEWKLGSVITWNRNKLHTSSNFEKYKVVKKMIVLCIE